MKVVIEGVTHNIPGIWLAGATRNKTAHEAVLAWHEQWKLEQSFLRGVTPGERAAHSEAMGYPGEAIVTPQEFRETR